MEYVTYEEFKKMDIRVGTIRAVEPVAGTDKLLKFQIEFGTSTVVAPLTAPTGSVDLPLENGLPVAKVVPEEAPVATEPDIRQIVSGIREAYPDFSTLVGKQVLYIVNLEPRLIRGEMSNGMLMAVDGLDGRPVFLVPESEVAPGAQVH
jgi:methionyl-tRNA synthetase